jgi:hypothetical protein
MTAIISSQAVACRAVGNMLAERRARTEATPWNPAVTIAAP